MTVSVPKETQRKKRPGIIKSGKTLTQHYFKTKSDVFDLRCFLPFRLSAKFFEMIITQFMRCATNVKFKHCHTCNDFRQWNVDTFLESKKNIKRKYFCDQDNDEGVDVGWHQNCLDHSCLRGQRIFHCWKTNNFTITYKKCFSRNEAPSLVVITKLINKNIFLPIYRPISTST